LNNEHTDVICGGLCLGCAVVMGCVVGPP
jgi:hypothetical protein